MVKKLSAKIILFILFAIILFPGVSFSFSSDTRCQILKDAINMCPDKLQKYLVDNYIKVHPGVHFADRHKIYIKPSEIELLYQGLIDAIKNNGPDDFNTAHQFGVIACFIAETIAPDYYKHFLPNEIVYDGFQEISDVNQNISTMVNDYRNPYRKASRRKDKELLFATAVNQIVNVWTSIWKSAGQEAGEPRPKGAVLAHQVIKLHMKSSRKRIQVICFKSSG